MAPLGGPRQPIEARNRGKGWPSFVSLCLGLPEAALTGRSDLSGRRGPPNRAVVGRSHIAMSSKTRRNALLCEFLPIVGGIAALSITPLVWWSDPSHADGGALSPSELAAFGCPSVFRGDVAIVCLRILWDWLAHQRACRSRGVPPSWVAESSRWTSSSGHGTTKARERRSVNRPH